MLRRLNWARRRSWLTISGGDSWLAASADDAPLGRPVVSGRKVWKVGRSRRSPSGKSRAHRRRVALRSEWAQRSSAMRANNRGLQVLPTPDGFEAAAGQEHRRVAEALIARHVQRMDRLADMPDWLNHIVLSPLAQMAILDQAVQPLLPDPRKPPAAAGYEWPDQLAWGVDSGIAAARLLLCGQFVGAATIARNQLERWTLNRAFLAGVRKAPGEPLEDFIANAWSTPISDRRVPDATALTAAFEGEGSSMIREPETEHAHLRFSDGREVCPALTWMTLSEILHGRGFGQAVAWDSWHCLDPGNISADVEVASAVIMDAVRVSWSHLRRVLAAIHLNQGRKAMAAALGEAPDVFSHANKDAIEEQPPRIAALARQSGLTCLLCTA